MKALRLVLVAVASAVAVAAIVIAVDRWRAAAAKRAQLSAAVNERDASWARMAALEKDLARAERRAVEAERDTAELLRAVNSARPPAGVAPAATNPGPLPVRVTVTAPGTPSVSPEEAERLAHERAYQQSLAKKRASEARRRAELDQAMLFQSPAEKFSLLIQAARERAAVSEFSLATRWLNEAMALKPADLAVSDEVRALAQALAAQSEPVSITLASDNVTWVSIADVRSPARFATVTIRLAPGDYEVMGRRPGFRDVRVPLQVRSGVTPPMVPVVCSVPVETGK